MESINKDDTGKTSKIRKSFCVLPEDYHGPLYTPCSGRLDGHTGNVSKGGLDDTNRHIGDLSMQIRALFHSIQYTALLNQNPTGSDQQTKILL